jgi:heptosyltransferase-2
LLPLFSGGYRSIPFPKALFDNPRAAARPDRAWQPLKLALALRRAGYDLVVLLHHLTTPFGALKYRALVRATGAPRIVGLDNGRGDFLTSRVTDYGFGDWHEAEYMLAVALAAGGAVVDPAPVLTPPVGLQLPFELPAEYVALYPATGPYSSARTWPAARFAEVARSLHAAGHALVILGGEDARMAGRRITAAVPAAVDLTGRTSLSQVAVIVAGARLAVGGDSFIGHLAGAVGCPVLAIFGPSNVRAWQPYGTLEAPAAAHPGHACAPEGLALHSGLPCAPCLYTGHSLGRPLGCPSRTCLRSIQSRQVAGAALRLLKEHA